MYLKNFSNFFSHNLVYDIFKSVYNTDKITYAFTILSANKNEMIIAYKISEKENLREKKKNITVYGSKRSKKSIRIFFI